MSTLITPEKLAETEARVRREHPALAAIVTAAAVAAVGAAADYLTTYHAEFVAARDKQAEDDLLQFGHSEPYTAFFKAMSFDEKQVA